MPAAPNRTLVNCLLAQAGTTYAEEAGIAAFSDDRTLAAAKDLGLPGRAGQLSDLSPRSSAKLAAALVRVSLDDDLRDKVLQAT